MWALLEFETEVQKNHNILATEKKTIPENEVKNDVRTEINNTLLIILETAKVSSLFIQLLILFKNEVMTGIARNVYFFIKNLFAQNNHDVNYFLM
jgi:hypothetical protein